MTADDLTDHEREVLDFAGLTYNHPGIREAEIRNRFGLTATSYHQELNVLLDKPAALVYAPMTVNRLRRLRDLRRYKRSLASLAG
jgi:hypothetical protein